jgi:hypothetical protein
MKKYLILFVFAMFATISAHAQLGLRAGANYAGYRGDAVAGRSNMEKVLGGHAGIYTMVPISSDNFFSLKPELLFSMKGTQYDLGSTNHNERLYYIDVPVLAHINTGILYFEGGPQLSVLVGDDVEPDLDYKRLSLGYAAGVGVGTPMGFTIGVRYNSDISKLLDDNSPKVYNEVFMLTLGYTLGSR